MRYIIVSVSAVAFMALLYSANASFGGKSRDASQPTPSLKNTTPQPRLRIPPQQPTLPPSPEEGKETTEAVTKGIEDAQSAVQREIEKEMQRREAAQKAQKGK